MRVASVRDVTLLLPSKPRGSGGKKASANTGGRTVVVLGVGVGSGRGNASGGEVGGVHSLGVRRVVHGRAVGRRSVEGGLVDVAGSSEGDEE
jgi:hypothetical protein